MKEVNYEFQECEISCDCCGLDTTINSSDFSEINQELKEEGWIFKKIDGEWYDFCCLECYQAFINQSEEI